MAMLGLDDGHDQVYVGFFDDDGLKAGLVDENGDPLGSQSTFDFDWSENPFHLRIERSQQHVTLFVDGTHLGSVDLNNVSTPSSTGDVTALVEVFGDGGLVDIDYLDVHDVTPGRQFVGLLTGEDPWDPRDYERVPMEWFGVFADIEVIRNPGDNVEIYVDNERQPSIQWPYRDLPKSGGNAVRTEEGYVTFGAFDSGASSQSLWKYLHYDIYRDVETETVNRQSVLNQGETATSPEPTIDEDPERVVIPVDSEYQVRLSREGMSADRVLSVTHKDSQSSIDFTLDEPHLITIDDTSAVQIGDPIEVVFYHGEPYGMDYLQANEPYTRLNEGTPPFAKSQSSDVETDVVFDSALNEPDDHLNEFDFVLNDGSVHIETVDKTDGFYGDLEFDWSQYGSEDQSIRPADDRWAGMDITGYQDTKSKDETDHTNQLQLIGSKGEVTASNVFSTQGVSVQDLNRNNLILLLDKTVSGSGKNLGSYAVDIQQTNGTDITIEGTFVLPDDSVYEWSVLRDDVSDRTRQRPLKTRSSRTTLGHPQHVIAISSRQARQGVYQQWESQRTDQYGEASDDVLANHPHSFLLDRYGSGLIRSRNATLREQISNPDGVENSSKILKTRTTTSTTRDVDP
jgi:hypothetical protein